MGHLEYTIMVWMCYNDESKNSAALQQLYTTTTAFSFSLTESPELDKMPQ